MNEKNFTMNIGFMENLLFHKISVTEKIGYIEIFFTSKTKVQK